MQIRFLVGDKEFSSYEEAKKYEVEMIRKEALARFLSVINTGVCNKVVFNKDMCCKIDILGGGDCIGTTSNVVYTFATDDIDANYWVEYLAYKCFSNPYRIIDGTCEKLYSMDRVMGDMIYVVRDKISSVISSALKCGNFTINAISAKEGIYYTVLDGGELVIFHIDLGEFTPKFSSPIFLEPNLDNGSVSITGVFG